MVESVEGIFYDASRDGGRSNRVGLGCDGILATLSYWFGGSLYSPLRKKEELEARGPELPPSGP